MPIKKYKALSADLENVEGDFEMPPEIAKEDALTRIDLLYDWICAIEHERMKAFADYFSELLLHSMPNITFVHAFEAYEHVVDQLDMDPPENLREICEEAYKKFQHEKTKAQPEGMLLPQDFYVNEAWLAFRVTNEPIHLKEGKFYIYLLMDVSSTYVFTSETVLIQEEIKPPIEAVEKMFINAYSKASKMPGRLIIPEDEKLNNGFLIQASKRKIPVEIVPMAKLELLLKPLLDDFNNNFKG